MQASRRSKLFITQGLLEERVDCTNSRKYLGAFLKLADYLKDLEKVYKISIGKLSPIQKLKKVPILRFSVFLDLMMWLYCLGEDIIWGQYEAV